MRHLDSERGNVEYYYDGPAVLEERNSDDDSLLAHYRYADRLLSLDTGAEVQFYHHDALGSTVNLTDDAGEVKVSYWIDPYGQIRKQEGTSVNRQVFTGQEIDENTGLVYFGARYYDPDTARFITQDSYLGESGTPPSLHRYLYAYSNPTVYIDLYGYRAQTPEEEAEIALRAEAASSYRAAYEEKGTLGKLWDRAAGGDLQKAAVIEGVNKRHSGAIDDAADGEEVIAVQNSFCLIEVDAVIGGSETKVSNKEFLTTSQAKKLEQYNNLMAASNALPAAIAMAIDPDNTAAIQISAAVWDIATNTAIAMHSRASNPTVKMSIEPRGQSRKTVVPKAVGADVLNNKPVGKMSTAEHQARLANKTQKKIPTLELSRKKYPNHTQMLDNAQTKGHSLTGLQKGSGTKEASKNRYHAQKKIRKEQGAPPKKHDYDEFPYASTKQGGEGSHVEPVLSVENQAAGRDLGQFYRKNKMKEHDKFNIKIVE